MSLCMQIIFTLKRFKMCLMASSKKSTNKTYSAPLTF